MYPYYVIAVFTRIAFNFTQTCTIANNIQLKTNGHAKAMAITPLQKFLAVFRKLAHSTALENNRFAKTAVLNKSEFLGKRSIFIFRFIIILNSKFEIRFMKR